MSSGVGPYVVSFIDSNPNTSILETTIYAQKTAAPVDLGGGIFANLETYNGAIPGPVLRLKVDDTVIVRLINLLDHPTGIHWHGIELANSADGTEVTQDPVLPAFAVPPPPPAPPGGTYLYKFQVPRPGLYWYHPHHHLSLNRVFRGLYGMIIVADPHEATLIANNVIPDAANTLPLVLSDITVCKAPGMNDAATYPNPNLLPVADRPEWLSFATAQQGPAPVTLCEIAPFGSATKDDDLGSAATVSYPVNSIPSIIRPLGPGGRTNEGQTVLTNGMNVGGRKGTPLAPAAALDAGAFEHNVRPGQGLRLQIVNCATTRYFRLILTGPNNVRIDLVRIGGEGGLLDTAVVEGGVVNGFDWKYESGEILLPPASRVDVVAAIPNNLAVGTKLTLWTRDFSRTGPGFSEIPTVPVMHLNVDGAVVVPAYTIGHGTQLRASIQNAAVEELTGPFSALLDPAAFVPAKLGMPDEDIELTAQNPNTGINGVLGTFEGFTPYTGALHINSSRYAELGDTLELTVTNNTGAHHPFHLHGFSFQPISIQDPSGTVSLPREFRDNLDVPSQATLTFRVRLDDRPLVDGQTMGGGLGRWLFHCHIFFHHHRGMISELVVTGVDGSEKPDVDVGGSWAYIPSGGIAKRRGRYFSRDGLNVNLSASVGAVASTGPGTWEWTYNTAGVPDGVDYVYITGEDTEGRKDQAVFRLKIGEPDDGADNGDPHILTVDGKYYDFQAAGEFTLLRDNAGVEIQVRQTPVPSATPITDPNTGLRTCVSVNTAVAARIGAHRIAIQPSTFGGDRLQVFVDGKAADISQRGIEFEAGRVSTFAAGNTTAYRIDYANYTVLTVTPWFWSSYNIWILNLNVAHTDADQGIMGRIPPDTWLPTLPSGATLGPKPAGQHERYVALYRTFANAWRVTDATSLFVYAPGTSTKTFTDAEWPPEKPPCKPKPEFQIPGANPPLVNIKPDDAERICAPVTVDDLHRGCVFDVATTGDKALVDSYKIAQEVRLTGTAVQLVADKDRTRPGEAVSFTAIVSALTRRRPTPTGTITFLIDDARVEKPFDVDKHGQASFKTASLSTGERRIRALYAALGENDFYQNSSSPTLRHLVQKRTPFDRSKVPYRLAGLFYEACDCFTICPCWLGNRPDEGACTGVFAWQVEKGSIDGIDVSGLRAVSVSHHTGLRTEAKQRVVIFVDDRATRQQAELMAAAFSGRYGGPLQELSDLLGELLAVERASIDLRREGRLTTLTVEGRVRVEGTSREGRSGGLIALNDGKLSKVLGSPAAVGESGRFQIGLGAHGMEMDVRGRSTMSGRFSYEHAPTLESRGPRAHG